MIALLHADGSMPNLAAMRLGSYFRERGEAVRLVRAGDRRTLFDRPSRAFGFSVFGFSSESRATLESEWGPALWGGTGVRVESSLAEVDASVAWDEVAPDYTLYPGVDYSLGFTQRGCRLSCGFCVVPKKEGKPRAAGTIASIWRGEPWPKKIALLDNDFFGGPSWRDRVAELRDGGFRVSLSQGINVRQIDEESAAAIASLEYRDAAFERKRLYTAWDNLGDEEVFRRGVALLEAAGVPAKHLMVYMLVGYHPKERPDGDGRLSREAWDRIFHRFDSLVALGARPYPMVFDRSVLELRAFARWAIRGLYRAVPWGEVRGPAVVARGVPGGASVSEPWRINDRVEVTLGCEAHIGGARREPWPKGSVFIGTVTDVFETVSGALNLEIMSPESISWRALPAKDSIRLLERRAEGVLADVFAVLAAAGGVP